MFENICHKPYFLYKVLNEKLRLINHELEKVKQDKACLEKELRETVERLERLVEASEGNDKEKQKTIIEETFTEILNKKLHLEKEVRAYILHEVVEIDNCTLLVRSVKK